ncbi:MAG TPA: ABC transporter substrate-binding protein [Beijerinckiaceae bacterium]|nr:ABC transporter substrate-binding protein [Beijerinckiaceae bacterium]
MKTTRRTFLQTTAAAAALTSTPGLLRAQSGPPRQRTLRAVMHGDLRVFDPIWTTANISAYHGAMIYDTLFALDGNMQPQPQMVGKHGVSDDKLTYTFELRDGLRFSDGSPVTADDVVASIRRWAARDGAGQHMMARVRDISKKDDKTFVIALREPYGLVVDVMAKTSTPLLYIMRKKEAETDPNQQITEYIGSGPFTFNREETKQGARYVYDRNPNYVPRSEPASGMAGGKVVKLDRVIYENMADSQTAMAALQAGEIDFYEVPPIDLLDQLEGDRNLKVEVLNKTGNVGWMRLNFLHPPFDKPEARQAMLHLINQEEYMKATFGNPKYYRKCASNFACGTPMENDENIGWFKEAPNPAKAKELFQKAGYDGRPVVILHATNIDFMNNAAQITAQRLREIGINAQLATSDWGGVVTRRAVKTAPDQGGWNVFITWAGGASVGNPIALAGHAANGEKGWFGWPSNDLHEQLRDKWASAAGVEEQKKVAREIQKNAWDFVPHVWLGQWVAPVAYRANLRGVLAIPEIVPFWNIEKV